MLPSDLTKGPPVTRFGNRAFRTVSVLGGTMAISALLVAPASAANATGVFNLVSVATGRCLDSNGSAYALACNGGEYQKWVVGFDGPSGDVSMYDWETNLCFALGYPPSNGAVPVTTEDCSQALYFTPIANSNGSWSFKDSADECLDSNTDGKGNNVGAVYVDPCNGGAYQQFREKAVSVP